MMLKRSVSFFLEKRKKDGITVTENVPIRMRVKFDGNRIEFTTGYRVDADKWDSARQKVRSGCTNKLKQSASQINTALARYDADIQTIFQHFEMTGVIPTPEQIKEAFAVRASADNGDKTPVQKQLSFWEIYDLFTKESGKMNDWTEATYEKFAAAKNHLRTFDKGMTFESLSETRLNEYVLFLRNKRDLRNSTIGKQVGFFKWFLRWAYHKGYHQNTAFEIFRPKLKQARKTVVFLTEEELIHLKAFPIPAHKSYLDRVRDVFLFCCFTGIRYSDVYNLKRSDVKGEYIEIVTVKTMDTLIIELNDHSKPILQKYADIAFENGKALPVVSNQKMNDYIKELCEIAGIDEQITLIHFRGNERIETVAPKHSLVGTHTGRRTFICNALAIGVPVQVVMQWTGHSDFKSMKPYIDIADKIRAGEMTRFNGFGKLP